MKKFFEDKFKKEFTGEAMGIQGSGWVYMDTSGTIKTIKNQNFIIFSNCCIAFVKFSFSKFFIARSKSESFKSVPS